MAKFIIGGSSSTPVDMAEMDRRYAALGQMQTLQQATDGINTVLIAMLNWIRQIGTLIGGSYPSYDKVEDIPAGETVAMLNYGPQGVGMVVIDPTDGEWRRPTQISGPFSTRYQVMANMIAWGAARFGGDAAAESLRAEITKIKNTITDETQQIEAISKAIKDLEASLPKPGESMSEKIAALEKKQTDAAAESARISEELKDMEAKANDQSSSRLSAIETRLSGVEGKLDATTPVTSPGGDMRADATPFITIPDRAGVRFSKLKFTFRDHRKNTAGGWAYPSRTTVIEVPAAWLDMGAVTGRTGWTATAQTFDDPTSTTAPPTTITRNSLFRTLSYGGTGARADYDIWLNFRRNEASWDIWFQGQHITTDRKPMNQYVGAYDIVAEYVVDTSAVDPKLKPLDDRITALTTRVKALEDRFAPKVAYTPPQTLTGSGITPAADFVKGPNNELAYDVAAAGASIPVGFDTVAGATYTLQIIVRTAALAQTVRFYGMDGTPAATSAAAAVNGIVAKPDGDWTTLSYQITGNGTRYSRAIQTTGAGAVILLPVLVGEMPATTPTVPDPRWFPAGRDGDLFYVRKAKSGAQAKSISFEFAAFGSPVATSIHLPINGSAISEWAEQGFVASPGVWLTITPPGAVEQRLVVGAHADGTVRIGIGPNVVNMTTVRANQGRVKNVVIDGIAADRMAS